MEPVRHVFRPVGRFAADCGAWTLDDGGFGGVADGGVAEVCGWALHAVTAGGARAQTGAGCCQWAGILPMRSMARHRVA